MKNSKEDIYVDTGAYCNKFFLMLDQRIKWHIKTIECNFCAVLIACLSADTIDIRSNRSKKLSILICSPLAYLTDVLTTVNSL